MAPHPRRAARARRRDPARGRTQHREPRARSYGRPFSELWQAAAGRGESLKEQAAGEWVAGWRWLPTLGTYTFAAEAFPFSLWLGPRETWGPLASKVVWASEQIKVGRSFGD